MVVYGVDYCSIIAVRAGSLEEPEPQPKSHIPDAANPRAKTQQLLNLHPQSAPLNSEPHQFNVLHPSLLVRQGPDGVFGLCGRRPHLSTSLLEDVEFKAPGFEFRFQGLSASGFGPVSSSRKGIWEVGGDRSGT